MKLSAVEMGDLTALKGLIILLQKSTFSLSLNEAVGAEKAVAWLQLLGETLNKTYQEEAALPKPPPAGAPFAIKDYQPIPGVKVGKK